MSRDNGLPDSQDSDLKALALPNGMAIGEADTPVVRKFAAAAIVAY